MKKVFSAKKFICGAATVLQIWPSGYSHYRRAYPHTSEVEALRGDWEKIGKDIRKATQEASIPNESTP